MSPIVNGVSEGDLLTHCPVNPDGHYINVAVRLEVTQLKSLNKIGHNDQST